MRILTGVRGKPICSAHRSGDGLLHGHTWTVTAWWANAPDAVVKQAELNTQLAAFDHRELGDSEAWGETLAAVVLRSMDCERVQVSRDAEGIYAVAER